MLPARSLRALVPRTFHMQQLRTQSTYQPPDPPRAQQPNPHRDFYKQFSRPIVKSFLIAVLTYQVLYYSFNKLESIEVKQEKGNEMQALEAELRGLTKGPAKS
ncbi:hypothetical protein LTR36_007112 [Oleoguttula mirabilis]|uniref:Uncharacterized protein n=1 Tax=Oleoguttula mirabilis TaxID=1507867 RepID=A0AAV9JAY7_9PEZI|nr:hypothetical protein LTR36_007112 [Oleoguttula mirabilis]